MWISLCATCFWTLQVIDLSGLGLLSSKLWQLSGLFRTGDNASFARAMAALHGRIMRERPDGLELVSK